MCDHPNSFLTITLNFLMFFFFILHLEQYHHLFPLIFPKPGKMNTAREKSLSVPTGVTQTQCLSLYWALAQLDNSFIHSCLVPWAALADFLTFFKSPVQPQPTLLISTSKLVSDTLKLEKLFWVDCYLPLSINLSSPTPIFTSFFVHILRWWGVSPVQGRPKSPLHWTLLMSHPISFRLASVIPTRFFTFKLYLSPVSFSTL